jgi:hypothetical protein
MLKKIKKKISILNVIFCHLISDFKLNLISLLLKKNSSYKKYVDEFKSKGFVVIPGYLNNEQVTKVFKLNIDELNKVPKNLVQERMSNIKLDNGVLIEKIKGSIKLKNIENSNSDLKKLFKLNYISIFSGFYSYGIFNLKKFLYSIIHGPLLLYNLTHDGSFKHYAVPDRVLDEVIAGDPHIDSPLPGIKAFVALKGLNEDNGPFCYFESSNSFKHLKNFYIKLFFTEKNITNIENTSRTLSNELISYCENNFNLYKATINAGDLVIFDTCGVHFASKLLKGQRHLMFLYY